MDETILSNWAALSAMVLGALALAGLAIYAAIWLLIHLTFWAVLGVAALFLLLFCWPAVIVIMLPEKGRLRRFVERHDDAFMTIFGMFNFALIAFLIILYNNP